MTSSSASTDGDGAGAGSARQAWEREYAEVHAYTTSYRDELDRGVEFLLGYLRGASLAIDGPILECACGRGRNLIPLASRGYAVVGLDHASTALVQFVKRAAREGVGGRATGIRHDLREPFPVRDASVGAVLDITAIDNLVEPAHRAAYGREVFRVLRPGGFAVVVTFDLDDGYYAPFRSAIDADGSVVRDPHTGIYNNLFRAADLDALFVPALQLVAGNRFDFVDEAAQERWTRRFHLRLYRRPAD
jgi:SAM-dependent methyltransferase